MEEEDYYNSLSEAGSACLFYYEETDMYFFNDDPTDFINPKEVAGHVYNILENCGVDYTALMNEKEKEEFNKINS